MISADTPRQTNSRFRRRDGLVAGEANALESAEARGGGEAEAGGDFVLAIDDGRGDDAGMRGEAEAGHLFGVPEQLVEMNFGGRDESPGAVAAFDNAVAGEVGEGVAGGHEADVVDSGKLALRGDDVAGFQLAGVDAAADGVLNFSVSRFVTAICHRAEFPLRLDIMSRISELGEGFPEHHIRTRGTKSYCYSSSARATGSVL